MAKPKHKGKVSDFITHFKSKQKRKTTTHEEVTIQGIVNKSEPQAKKHKKMGTKKKDHPDFVLIPGKELYVGHFGEHHSGSSLIAGFDFDGTLSRPLDGKFPTHADDYSLVHERLPERLQSLEQQGYHLVIFTNQNGIKIDKTSGFDVWGRISGILKLCKVSKCTVIAAIEQNQYRKPRNGMWNFFTESLNGGHDVDLDQSFFVGDSAGRINPKDHSDADYLFALNTRLNFILINQFIADTFCPKDVMKIHKQNTLDLVIKRSFNPSIIPDSASIEGPLSSIRKVTSSGKFIIFMVGLPASGKSTFCKTHFPSTDVISQDDLKQKDKVKKVITSKTKEGTSFIIDNTNSNKAIRSDLLKLIPKTYKTIAIQMNVTQEQAFHNNLFRRLERIIVHDVDKPTVPWFVISKMHKGWEDATKEEGFDHVIRIPFVPSFTNDVLKDLYCQYL